MRPTRVDRQAKTTKQCLGKVLAKHKMVTYNRHELKKLAIEFA